MTLITRRYAKEQKRLHEASDAYGSRGFNWAYLVAGIALVEKCKTILDYGCGKGSLRHTLRSGGMGCAEYDPGITGKDLPAKPADLVVCTDVLEHVEPQLLDNVVVDLSRVTQRLLLVAISIRPSGRLLSSGQNAHLLIKDAAWWQDQFKRAGFEVRRTWKTGGHEWVALMNIKSGAASPGTTT